MKFMQDALGAPRSRSLSCRIVDQWTSRALGQALLETQAA